MSNMGFPHRDHEFFRKMADELGQRGLPDPKKSVITGADYHAIMAGSVGGTIIDFPIQKRNKRKKKK